ncbi:hypothetical protein OIE62_05015 [Streptomyces scopuliridis]|uniref:Uncharacterized protein n=1 Tax=Streptomyces scopuliridis TaxID=452529 RepID=A0ACD4ZVT1_9ACTN|nr:hypothetical protein [Streptomyces scopuliridis]WSC02019.1 hypothetical protein OG835_36815 [Streptomyces scopuliridis]WSC04444.1 hypothetical protein OIE62_05015 [Streptomyces scopuliridis]
MNVAGHSGDVAEALLTAADNTTGAPGPLERLGELVRTAGQFANALETRQGGRSAVRLNFLARQLGALRRELLDAGEELSSAVGVLPPHRAPTSAAPTTTPPSTAAPAAAPVHHR